MTGPESRFGDVLRHYRLAAGLTQEELAERAGVSTRGISDLERGARGLPRKDTLRLLVQALDLSHADQAVLIAAARRPPVPVLRSDQGGRESRLPVPLTPLIGRETEVAAISALLGEPTFRLLTLTGSGGTGKTRLALALATQQVDAFPDGVVFVPLASIADVSLVAATIARQLDVREAAGRTVVEALMTHLRDKRLLLVLDNFEHVLPAAPLVTDLLGSCPLLKVLVTSRVRLRLRGEREVPVPPLALPTTGSPYRQDDLARVPAVQLFVARGQDVNPDFALTAENASAIVEICRRLDGLPLALELAAPRVKILSPAALLTRLDRALPLLTGGAQDLPERQQTMRQTIAWSHDLLTEQERVLFRRLGVFTGGWTLEATEVVANCDGRLDVLEGLTSLVDKSLVRQHEQPDGTSRFGMLETVREFALEHLTAHEEASGVQGAHAAYYQQMVEEADGHLLLPGQESWLVRLETDLANIRAALGWLTTHDPASALALAGALRWFWLIRGNLTEGITILERSLALSADVPLLVRARALIGLGFLTTITEDLEGSKRAESALRDGHALAQQVDNPWEQGWALLGLGIAASSRHAYAESEARLQEAIAVIQPLAAHHPAARARVFAFLSDLGATALARGELELATARLEEALAGARETGFAWLESLVLLDLGTVALRRGDLPRALTCYREALVIAQTQQDRRIAAAALAGAADVARAQGHPDRAQRLRATATALRNAILLVPATSPDPSARALPTTGPAVAWDDVFNDVAALLEDASD